MNNTKIAVDRNFLSELKAGIMEAITSEDGLDGAKGEHLMDRLDALLDTAAWDNEARKALVKITSDVVAENVKLSIFRTDGSQLTDLRGEAYHDTLSRILGRCGKNITADAIAMKPITALTIGHLALLYQLPYKAICEWLEENRVIPTGSYDELRRRGLKVKEVLDIVKEQYTV